MEQLFLKKFFSRTCTLRGKKWCTIDLWWLICKLCEQNWCFPTTLFWGVDELYMLKWWMSYMNTKEVFLTYFAQVFCFELLLLLRDSWCALMIDKQNAVPLISRCSFLLPYANLFLKRSEFKQGLFRLLCICTLCNHSDKMLLHPNVLLDTTRFSDRSFKTKKKMFLYFSNSSRT